MEGELPVEVEKVSLEGKILNKTGLIRDEGEYYIAEVRFENPFDSNYPVVLTQVCISVTEAERGIVKRDFYGYNKGLYSRFTMGAAIMPGGGLSSLIMESENCDPVEIENFMVKGGN